MEKIDPKTGLTYEEGYLFGVRIITGISPMGPTGDMGNPVENTAKIVGDPDMDPEITGEIVRIPVTIDPTGISHLNADPNVIRNRISSDPNPDVVKMSQTG